MILRLIDGHLLITIRPQMAVPFVYTLSAGHPEYGSRCMISQEKTLASLDYEVQIKNIILPGQNVLGYSSV